MRKKGCYHKNRPFRLLVAAALRFVQSYLNDIALIGDISKEQRTNPSAKQRFYHKLVNSACTVGIYIRRQVKANA